MNEKEKNKYLALVGIEPVTFWPAVKGLSSALAGQLQITHFKESLLSLQVLENNVQSFLVLLLTFCH